MAKSTKILADNMALLKQAFKHRAAVSYQVKGHFFLLQNSNFKTAWLNPAEHAVKWLSRGHLNITMILSTADQTTKVTGRIGIKRTCNSEWNKYVILTFFPILPSLR